MLIIQLRTFWCEQFGRARGLWRAVSGAGPRDLASAISRVFFGVRSSSLAFCESLSGASEDGNSVKLSRLTPETSITPPTPGGLPGREGVNRKPGPSGSMASRYAAMVHGARGAYNGSDLGS